MMKKKTVTLILFLLMCPIVRALSFADQAFDVIKKREWGRLASLCADNTHEELARYFTDVRSFSLLVDSDGQWTYFARFSNYAEVGKLNFTINEGKLAGLAIKKGVSSLLFVEKFLSCRIHDQQVRMGDAVITLKDGVIYQAQPLDSLFIFVGEWTFFIRPGNEEEQLTLQNQLGKDSLKEDSQIGLFVMDPGELVLDSPREMVLADELPLPLRPFFAEFISQWGQPVAPLNEVWFLSFPFGFSAALFRQSSGSELYRYTFSPSQIPDSSLILLPKRTFLLFYNARTGLRISPGATNDVRAMNLKVYFNPHNGYLAGTSDLDFVLGSDLKVFELAEGLMVKAKVLDDEQTLYKFGDSYNLLGNNLQNVRISYAGRLFSTSDLVKRTDPSQPFFEKKDHFIVLSRTPSFYPNPGVHFFKSRVFVSHPDDVSCLVSGVRTSQLTEKGLTKSVFESEGVKDLALICGKFILRETVDSHIPLNLYAAKDLSLYEYFRKGEMRDIFNFLLSVYPALPFKEINLVLSRGSDYGGISHPGLIHFNVVQTLFKDDSSLMRRIRTDSPVIFHEINQDNLVHELSHQWWGGVISWNSYQDQWITEGLAQFSTLFYLQKTLGRKAFSRVVEDARRWVIRKSSAGPMVFGQRILNLTDSVEAFQSVVYNKGALVFMMFKEMLGEKEFLKRIENLVERYRYQSLSSALFIKILADNDGLYEAFFNKWVYSRIVPSVKYQIVAEGDKVRISVRQEDGAYVFPLTVQIKTGRKTDSQTIIVNEPEQTFEFTADGPVVSATLETLFSPVRLEKE